MVEYQRFVNPFLPVLAPFQILVLKDWELFPRLDAHFRAEALAEFGETSAIGFVIKMNVAEKSCWRVRQILTLSRGCRMILMVAKRREKTFCRGGWFIPGIVAGIRQWMLDSA